MKATNSTFVILLCGIPGSGKSYLANKLWEYYTKVKNYKTILINFDEIFINKSKNNDKLDLEKFKEETLT